MTYRFSRHSDTQLPRRSLPRLMCPPQDHGNPLRIKLWMVRYIDLLPLMQVMCRAMGTSQLIFFILSVFIVHSCISSLRLISSAYDATLRPSTYRTVPMLLPLLKIQFIILNSTCPTQHWLGSHQQPSRTGSLFEAMPGGLALQRTCLIPLKSFHYLQAKA